MNPKCKNCKGDAVVQVSSKHYRHIACPNCCIEWDEVSEKAMENARDIEADERDRVSMRGVL